MQSPDELYAELYDASVPDWPGEIEFYRGLAAEATARGEASPSMVWVARRG